MSFFFNSNKIKYTKNYAKEKRSLCFENNYILLANLENNYYFLQFYYTA